MRKRDSDHTLEDVLESSLERYVDFLVQLLQIPNERMREHDSVRLVGRALEAQGCAVEFFEGEGLGEPTPGGPPLNCIAHRKGGGGGRSLLLQAHMDTVPPGERQRWRDSPWSGTIREGRVYGRGAHDDRVGAAMLWMVADLLQQLDVTTAGDLHFLVTTEEEFSCGGMRSYLKQPKSVQPDGHLLVDGNRANRCITGHPGVLNFTIRIEGPFGSAQGSAHEANPVELMGRLIESLGTLEQQVRDLLKALHIDPRWPPAVIVATEIQSAGWISNVPETCVLRGFCSVPPPLTLGEYRRLFGQHLHAEAETVAWLKQHPPELHWGPLELPAMITDESTDFFRLLAQAHQQGFGTPLVSRWIGGWGDMVLLGCANAIFYGPGGGGGDHGYDEYYELKDLSPMLKSLVNFVLAWCGRVSLSSAEFDT